MATMVSSCYVIHFPYATTSQNSFWNSSKNVATHSLVPLPSSNPDESAFLSDDLSEYLASSVLECGGLRHARQFTCFSLMLSCLSLKAINTANFIRIPLHFSLLRWRSHAPLAPPTEPGPALPATGSRMQRRNGTRFQLKYSHQTQSVIPRSASYAYAGPSQPE